MLELSRLRLGIVKVVNQLINLDMTIQEILEIFKNEAKFKKIKIQQQGNNF
jgi:signal transduction histidine kinase